MACLQGKYIYLLAISYIFVPVFGQFFHFFFCEATPYVIFVAYFCATIYNLALTTGITGLPDFIESCRRSSNNDKKWTEKNGRGCLMENPQALMADPTSFMR